MRILEPMVYALQHYTRWTCCLPSPSAAITKEKTLFFFPNLLSYTQSRGDNWESDLDTRVQEYDFFPPEWAATRVCA